MMEGFFLLATRGICKFNLWFRYAIDALIGNCRVRMEFGIELISYCYWIKLEMDIFFV